MDRSSLKGNRAERDVHKKETGDAVVKLNKTAADVVKVADAAGKIQSKLSDVNDMLKAQRNQILDSGDKAGRQDAALVETQEKKTKEHQQAVEVTEKETTAEKQKAEAIKPADSRILSGSAMAKQLEQTRIQLKEISVDLKNAAAAAGEKRIESIKRVASAISKNRK